MVTARVVELRRNPSDVMSVEDFAIVDAALPAILEGQVLVRNRWMSIDPYMRLMIGSQAGYLAMAQPGDSLRGAAVGIVEQSRDAAVPVGSLVLSQMGWRSAFVAAAAEVTILGDTVPGEWHIGVLGLTGITAYLGIEKVLQPAAGETLFVSGAAGAVGSLACQLARRRGARVLGSAGSAAKAAWLRDEVGVDAVINYREQPLAEFLMREAPEGLDCYFDNVGGATLDAALRAMKPYGRVGLCGAMSNYQSGDYRAGPGDFFLAIEKSLRLEGFNAFLLSPQENATAIAILAEWARSGALKPLTTLIRGLDAMPAAFVRLFQQGYTGKAIIALDD